MYTILHMAYCVHVHTSAGSTVNPLGDITCGIFYKVKRSAIFMLQILFDSFSFERISKIIIIEVTEELTSS